MADWSDYCDDIEDQCWNCGGDGFVASCFTEYACMYPDDGCDECLRRCDVCQPRKPTPEIQQLRQGRVK